MLSYILNRKCIVNVIHLQKILYCIRDAIIAKKNQSLRSETKNKQDHHFLYTLIHINNVTAYKYTYFNKTSYCHSLRASYSTIKLSYI